jgi:hypothetical protein
MATIILRDAGSVSSPGSTAKGSPLTNYEVDNNFSNINTTIGVLTSLTNLNSSNTANLVFAINEISSNTGVTANTYGNAIYIPSFVVNSKGKISSASNVLISIANSAITGNIIASQLQPTAVTAGVYGNATIIPTFTVDYSGRITSAANATITTLSNVIVGAGGTPVSGYELTVNGAYTTGAAIAVGASAIDASTGNYFTKTAAGALVWTVTNVPTSAQTYGFILELTAGGSGAQTWMTGTKWPSGTAPTLQTANVDILVFLTRDGGSTWRGSLVQGDSR